MRETDEAIAVLNSGKTLLYPADTLWGLGCDANNSDSIEQINTIKSRITDGYIILVSDIEMLKSIVGEISEPITDIITNSNRPTSIIYPKSNNLAQNATKKDGSVAIRVVSSGFCHQLIKKFKKPIISTSANISGKPAPNSFNKIDQFILSAVDHVVNLPHEKIGAIPSMIIKVGEDGSAEVIRD
ncbi:MAG: Sua5/YciO/YrdC/YwlC family protein [Flavobacteriales bacterium]|nr:Sua5/YciO/YrdC/YwlC family protein [Flavobacteriales bacterium]